MKRRLNLGGRISVSGLAALIVGYLVLRAGIEEIRTREVGAFNTQSRLRTARRAVIGYRNKYHRLPKDLSALSAYDGGIVPDDWGHEWVYIVSGKDFEIISLGRDQKAGGVGLDCDQSSERPLPGACAIPMSEALKEPWGEGIRKIAITCCLLVFALSMGVTQIRIGSKGELVALLSAVVATVVATAFIGAIHLALYYSGH